MHILPCVLPGRMIPIMSKTIFKIGAWTDPGLLRENNEDNFTVCADLSKTEEAWFIPEAKSMILGDLGCVLAVADGMGGANAGEVASRLAIEAIEERFSDREQLTKIKESLKGIEKFMVEALICADAKINERIKKDRSTEGMGTTMVLLWAVNGMAYFCWCGDSRAYLYNKKGVPRLRRLSKDHSYVQQLVDEGKLTEDEAFDHPESNIITKCLGGGVDAPSPDFAHYPMQKGDIFLLCTDGLCGVCKDIVISTELDTYEGDFKGLGKNLIALARNEGGPDNITVTLLEILDANEPLRQNSYTQTLPPDMDGNHVKQFKGSLRKKVVFGLLGVALIVAGFLICMPHPHRGGFSSFKGLRDSIPSTFNHDSVPPVSNPGSIPQALEKDSNQHSIVSPFQDFRVDQTEQVEENIGRDSLLYQMNEKKAIENEKKAKKGNNTPAGNNKPTK